MKEFNKLFEEVTGKKEDKEIINEGKFEYETREGKIKGQFNIYQSKKGSIYMVMGNNNYTELSEKQIKDLQIQILELNDFDEDLYRKYYR